jgi:magnesium transporter
MLGAGSVASSEQVSLFMRPGLVLTFQERPGDSFEPVRNRLRNGRGLICELGADYLSYALIEAALDHYFPVLEDCDNRLDDLTEDVLRNPRNEIVAELHQLKRELFNLRRIVWASREMINNLMRDEHAAITSGTRTYLRDAYDHCIQLMDMLDMQRDVAASLFDIYLSSLSNRVNEIMKVLTMIATIFIPLGFIASLYGVNFDRASPWNMPELGWRFGYPLSLAMMVATVAGMVWWFWRKGWVGGRKPRRRTVTRGPRRGPSAGA